MSRRGALLLEAVIALAIFVATGIAILAVMRQGVGNLQADRDRIRAMDIARSTLAQIECHLATIESLDGPVRAWRDESSRVAFDDSPPPDTGWDVVITTSDAGIAGLSRVKVVVTRRDRPLADLTQLIPLVSAAEGATP